MLTLYAVTFTGIGGDTEHTAHLTEEDANRAGAELARRKWQQARDLLGEPLGEFPETENDEQAMDALRDCLEVRLEVEPIDVGPEVIRALALAAQLQTP